MFKIFAPFTDCITEINNTQVDNVKDLHVVMAMYNLIEYIDNYSKTLESLYPLYWDKPNTTIADSESFKFKSRLLDNTNNAGIINEYLSNFWRTLEMPLINCKINLTLTWAEKCVISEGNKATTFKISGTALYASVPILLTEDNSKLLQQLKSDFKGIGRWNQYLDYLIDPSFHRVNKIFALLFENNDDRTWQTGCF